MIAEGVVALQPENDDENLLLEAQRLRVAFAADKLVD